MIDATTPVRTASIITEPMIWPSEAPTARSSPVWRVRWATVILKALKITKRAHEERDEGEPDQEVAEDVHELLELVAGLLGRPRR